MNVQLNVAWYFEDLAFSRERDIFVESVVEIGAVLSGSWPAVVLQFIMIAGGNHGNGLAFVISFKRLKVSL